MEIIFTVKYELGMHYVDHGSPTRGHICKLCIHYNNFTVIYTVMYNTCYFSMRSPRSSSQYRLRPCAI